MWQINNQLASFFRSLGDKSYPKKIVRAVILMIAVEVFDVCWPFIWRLIYRDDSEYYTISRQIFTVVSQLAMLFQTCAFYYLADVGFGSNDEALSKEATQRLMLIAELNESINVKREQK